MRDPETPPDEDIVITCDGRLAGCRGRVLIAVLFVVLLILGLLVVLVLNLLNEAQPLPGAAQAAPEAPASSAPYRFT